MTIARERNRLRLMTKAASRISSLDLFESSQAADRRKGFLILSIKRPAGKLRIEAPSGLATLNEDQLKQIRQGMSRRLAEAK